MPGGGQPGAAVEQSQGSLRSNRHGVAQSQEAALCAPLRRCGCRNWRGTTFLRLWKQLWLRKSEGEKTKRGRMDEHTLLKNPFQQPDVTATALPHLRPHSATDTATRTAQCPCPCPIMASTLARCALHNRNRNGSSAHAR